MVSAMNPSQLWPEHVRRYAEKHAITIVTQPGDMEDYLDTIGVDEEDFDLEPPKKGTTDPWGFKVEVRTEFFLVGNLIDG